MFRWTVVVISVFSCFFSIALIVRGEEKSINVKFLSAKCQSLDQSWVKVLTCRVKSLSRNTTVLNIEVDLFRQVGEPILIALDISMRSTTRFTPIWPTTKFEFCSAMRNEGMFGKMIFFIIGFFRDSVPQLFQKCPFKVGYLDLRNITVDNSKKYPLDQWIPAGIYKLKMLLTQGKTNLFSLEIQVDLKSGLDWSQWGTNSGWNIDFKAYITYNCT